MESSRKKSQEAQEREMKTIQPKEYLSSLTKAKITIENYLGGKYHFTTDEIVFKNNKLFLIEAKHSKNSLLPSIADIKDGLLKIILYTNLKNVIFNGKKYNFSPVVKLTSSLLKGEIKNVNQFLNSNQPTKEQKNSIKILIEEAKQNNFILEITK